MYNILISVALGLVVLLGIGLTLGWVPAVLPAILVAGLAMFLLSRRTGQQIEPKMVEVGKLLQAQVTDRETAMRNLAEARSRLQAIKDEYSPWQVMLAGQIDAQIGMLDYMQMDWDKALPNLEAGKWRNGTALACIGCIHWRKGDKPKAFQYLQEAVDAAPKEAILYVVQATLLSKADQRDEALAAVGRGLKEIPGSDVLKQVQEALANKRKLDTSTYPQTWYQFFPEDYRQLQLQQALVRGRKDGQQVMLAPPGGGLTPPGAKMNRKQRRGR